MRTPFLGPFSVSRSTNVSDNRLVNLFPEIVETKDGKAVGAFYSCPGLNLLASCGIGPIRGGHVMAGTAYVVSANKVYSVSPSWATALIGTIGTSSGPVTMIDNGRQMNIFDGLGGYLVTAAGAFSALALPFSGPVSGGYQDGFGFVNQAGTNVWWQSNLADLSVWGALNFSSADAKPDQIVAVADIHREVWLLKQNDVEIWVNAGLSGFAFQRLDGVFLEIGCAAAASAAKAGEALIWLSRSEGGQGIVVMATGYQPVRISTHPIETAIASYPTISDAVGYSYQQEGHIFYVLTFPSGNATWVYDVTASRLAGVPMWHQRAAFRDGQFNRHWGNCYMFFNGQQVIGDYLTGNLYAFDMNAQLDNGAQRKWLRSWRALGQPQEKTVRFSSLRIDLQTGIGVPDGTNPQIVLRYSDDGGHLWSKERFAAAGRTGETARRVKFNRLGSTRRNSGLDRIFELSSSDAFSVSLIGAELE